MNLYEQFFGDNAENFIQQVKFYGKELKMKKLIVTDLDKTLLNDDQLISEKNIKAIYDLLDNNVKVIFASGRSYENIKTEILEKISLKFTSCFIEWCTNIYRRWYNWFKSTL